MANVYNPLHKFRSTQYHFVWLCAASDEVIANIDKEEDVSDLSRYYHPTGGPQNKYNAKDMNGGSYVVLYNSMTDVEFSIDAVTIEHIIAGGGTSQNYVTTNAQGTVNLRIEVIEPYTADFVAALYTAADAVGTDLVHLKCGLKILFVGYPDDNNVSSPHIISDVNATAFIINDMTIALTARGAHYDIECTPLFNNAAYHHSASKIGGLTTALPESLPDAITKFETQANEQSKKSQESNPDSKPYKYKVILDDAYKDPKYKLDIVSDDQRNTFNGAKPLTKNNTSSDKVPDYADQTADSTNATGGDTTQGTQQNKDSKGIVGGSSDPVPDMTAVQYGEEKLRSFDSKNFEDYQKYRDTLFITAIQKGANVDRALQDARIGAADKFSKEIQSSVDKSNAIK